MQELIQQGLKDLQMLKVSAVLLVSLSFLEQKEGKRVARRFGVPSELLGMGATILLMDLI